MHRSRRSKGRSDFSPLDSLPLAKVTYLAARETTAAATMDILFPREDNSQKISCSKDQQRSHDNDETFKQALNNIKSVDNACRLIARVCLFVKLGIVSNIG